VIFVSGKKLEEKISDGEKKKAQVSCAAGFWVGRCCAPPKSAMAKQQLCPTDTYTV
jgi:hypothetical protein